MHPILPMLPVRACSAASAGRAWKRGTTCCLCLLSVMVCAPPAQGAAPASPGDAQALPGGAGSSAAGAAGASSAGPTGTSAAVPGGGGSAGSSSTDAQGGSSGSIGGTQVNGAAGLDTGGAAATAAESRATTVLLFPTAVVDESAETEKKKESRNRSTEEHPAYARARELDEILTDGVQDLQLRLDISESQERASRVRTEVELVELASKRRVWVVAPSLEFHGGTLLVRIVAVPPGSEVALARTERLNARELSVRGVVMLRDLLVGRSPSPWGAGGTSSSACAGELADPARRLTAPVRSEGRAALALNAALLGAFVGYSIQRSSDSEDPRILYPLMALGTGFGLGVSAVVAEEWDVGVGEAWYLSAGAWWPAVAGVMLAGAKSNTGAADQYEGGLIGAGAGLTVATVALALRRGTTEGGALIAHSGGAFGTFLGGMSEYAIRGSTARDPAAGLGYGAAIGVVTGGALALAVKATPSQVILVDLGAGLGGLAGAAVTSPFLFKEDNRSSNDRVFVIGTMAATVVGGLVGAWYAYRGGAGHAAAPPVVPYAAMVGGTQARDGAAASGFSFGVRGAF